MQGESAARRVLRFNHRFAAIFGYGAQELTGKSLARLYPSPDDFDHTDARWSVELAQHGQYADERIMRRKDDALFWCRVRGQSMDPAQPLPRAVWRFSDISAARPVVALTRRERQGGCCWSRG